MTTKLGPYKVHPVAALFPMMDDTALAELTDDIKTHGLHQPIVLNHDETVIVDGRNRYQACRKLKLEPDFEVLSDEYTDDDLRDYVISANLKRRHLNTSQRSMVATALEKLIAATNPRGRRPGESSQTGEDIRERDYAAERTRMSATKAAAALDVSPRSVVRAKAIKRDAPDLVDKVLSRDMSLRAADVERKRRNGSHLSLVGKPAPDARVRPRDAGWSCSVNDGFPTAYKQFGGLLDAMTRNPKYDQLEKLHKFLTRTLKRVDALMSEIEEQAAN